VTSFWDYQTYFSKVDVTIVGAGFTGLQTALELRAALPHSKILVVDKHDLAFGASNRNAGFACFGSPSELLDDLTREPFDAVIQRVANRWKGLQLLQNRLNETNWQNTGGFELFKPCESVRFENSLDILLKLNEALKDSIGFAPYQLHDISSFPFSGFNKCIAIKNEGMLNPSLAIQSLKKLCLDAGILVVTGIELERFEVHNNSVSNFSKDLTWQSNALILATNAFSSALLPEINVKPARGQVLITEPIENLGWQGTFHLDEGYYYFRNVGNRILLGGGRNTDFETEFTEKTELNSKIQEKLTDVLYTYISPNKKPKIEHRWSGIMAFGKNHEKEPLLEETAPGVFTAVRLGGMGVALSARLAQMVAAKAAAHLSK
jgi:gamma-glutamylputrescine oxidase